MAVYDFVQPGHTMGLRLLSQIISNPRTGFMAFFLDGLSDLAKEARVC
jgi:hypothetical protein